MRELFAVMEILSIASMVKIYWIVHLKFVNFIGHKLCIEFISNYNGKTKRDTHTNKKETRPRILQAL